MGVKEENILYELLTLAEWTQNFDSGLQKIAVNTSISSRPSFFSSWRFFTKSKLDNKKYLQTEYPWQLAVSQDGKVIGILQETLLEIRTAKDEYSSIVGRASIPCDQYPQLRKLSWSPDNTFLAVARDNGVVSVYNLFGCNTATVQPRKYNSSILQPVVGLLFIQPKFKSTKWSNELFIIYSNREVRSILLSSLDGCDSEENANLSLEQFLPLEITSVAYHSLHHIIVIASPCNGNEHGISVWRILNDYPHLKVAFGCKESTHNSSSLLRLLPGYASRFSPNTVIKMKISPNGEVLACLHYSGEISLWQLPGIHLLRRWDLTQQPDYNKINPEIVENIQDERIFHPVDINWWLDTALVIARRSGALSVCSVSTLHNLLGDSPEFLSFSPQISSVHGSKSAVIALECEVENNYRFKTNDTKETENECETSDFQESIQAALYSFTDIERFEPKRKTPRIIQRTYRLLALKRTTPEELYARKIELEDYDSALVLAQTYNLDCDLVYQKQWRSNSVTKDTIYNYLDKIKNIYWVLNECTDRVPDTADAAKELLEFGLKKTDFNGGLEINKIDPEKKKMISYRRQILLFLDNLLLYQKIVDGPLRYNADDYDEFRRRSAAINTVNLARQEKWQAVSIMFTYKGNDVLKHRLPILSNFPETLPPIQYRSLLPEIVENEVLVWDTKRLRFPDWSEEKSLHEPVNELDTSTNYIYEYDPTLRRFEANTLTPQLVEEWYVKRTYEIEKNTGLVEYARSFAILGRERNVKSLDQLLFYLSTLHCLVYTIQDQEITLSKLETLTVLEQAKLLLSKTSKNSFVQDLSSILHPFAVCCEQQKKVTFYSLLRSVFLSLSEKDLELPLELFTSLKEGSSLPFKLSLTEEMRLAVDCLYACSSSDQLDNSYLILECLPVRGPSLTAEEETLHDKIDELEKHLEICDILSNYKSPKPLCFILEHEGNKTVGMQLMQEMAKFVRDKTLNFSDLLSDLKRLQTSVFPSVDSSFCYELVAFTQMTCECEEIILSAEDLLQCNKDEADKLIPLEKSIHLVLQAAETHFERAVSYNDQCIRLARTCLHLIDEPNPKIQEELDLIDSLQLLEDFGVKLLPIQVHKCNDKMKLIESCLEARPDSYQSCQRLMQLGHTLRVCGEDRKKREGELLMLIAKHALKSSDYEYCSEICNRLISRNFSSAWPIVHKLGMNGEYKNRNHKVQFLAFAILHCPAENLEEIIESRIEQNSPIFPKPNWNNVNEIYC